VSENFRVVTFEVPLRGEKGGVKREKWGWGTLGSVLDGDVWHLAGARAYAVGGGYGGEKGWKKGSP